MTDCLLQKLWHGCNGCVLQKGYVSAGMGYSFSALLMFLMTLRSCQGTETPFGLVFSHFFSMATQKSQKILMKLVEQWIVPDLQRSVLLMVTWCEHN